jgi:aminoglycoside phosphotransferase (APT) family kinase protein
MGSTRCSDRLGVIDDERFQAALDRFGLGRLLGATPIARGLFGQNVFLHTSAGDFVLRGCPHDDRQLRHERFFCRLLHERTTVPVPWPYLIDERNDLFGWTYALMPRMRGIHIDDGSRKSLSMDERAEIASAMGATIAAIGDARGEHGRYDRARDGIVAGGSAADESRRWMDERIGDAERYCPATIAGDRTWLDTIVARGLDALMAPCPATPTTTDFGEGNSVVERHDGAWRVSGVFDFMEYAMGDLERSLARPLSNYLGQDPALAQAFLGGYTRERPLRPGARERLAFNAIGDRFLIWNYGHSNAQWFPAEMTFRAFTESALMQLDELVAATC